MSNEERTEVTALDPDAPAGRTARTGSARGQSMRDAGDARREQPALQGAAEATLSLEPLRLPIAGMVQGTLRAEREALERLGADLRGEFARLQEWHAREEALQAEQTALYRQAAEHWREAGERAAALCEGLARLEGLTAVLHGAVEAAIGRFWQRALLAAGLLSLVGAVLVAGLCGVVWLALAHR